MGKRLKQVSLYAKNGLEEILIGYDMIDPDGEIVSRNVDPEAMRFVYNNWVSFVVGPARVLGTHFTGQPKPPPLIPKVVATPESFSKLNTNGLENPHTSQMYEDFLTPAIYQRVVQITNEQFPDLPTSI